MMIQPTDIYSCICSSIIRFGETFRKANALPSATYFDWDAHAQLSELPENDVVGPAGIGLSNEGKITQVVFSIGLATVGDANLFRLRKMMSQLYGELQPEMTIPVYDTTGTRRSWLVVKSPVTIAPVSKSEVRACQFISVMALLDPHASSSLG
jgi:hypothetical protein